MVQGKNTFCLYTVRCDGMLYVRSWGYRVVILEWLLGEGLYFEWLWMKPW